jgi:hypothetical protein
MAQEFVNELKELMKKHKVESIRPMDMEAIISVKENIFKNNIITFESNEEITVI